MTSLKTSLRNTGWRRQTPKISLSKSDISPEWLYHSRSRFSKKLMVSVSWNRKTRIFLIAENKSWPERYTDLLKTSLLPECRWRYLGNDFEFLQDSVPSHRAKVTQQFLRQNTPDSIAKWMGIIVSRSQSFRLLHLGYPACFGVRRPTTSVCKTTGPERGNQKQMEGGHNWDTIAQWKNDWMWLETRM